MLGFMPSLLAKTGASLHSVAAVGQEEKKRKRIGNNEPLSEAGKGTTGFLQ